MIFIGRNDLRLHTLYMLITECLKLLIVLLKLVPNLQRIRIISKDAIVCFIKVLTLILYTFSLHFLIFVFSANSLTMIFCKSSKSRKPISISHLSSAVWVLFKILQAFLQSAKEKSSKLGTIPLTLSRLYMRRSTCLGFNIRLSYQLFFIFSTHSFFMFTQGR